MPITQERLAALLTAGQDYQQALEKLVKEILHEYHQLVGAGAVDPAGASQAKALNAIATCALWANTSTLLNDAATSGAVLASEAKHLSLTMKRNIASARRMQVKRREALVPERPETAPRAITPIARLRQLERAQPLRPQFLSREPTEAELNKAAAEAMAQITPAQQAEFNRLAARPVEAEPGKYLNSPDSLDDDVEAKGSPWTQGQEEEGPTT